MFKKIKKSPFQASKPIQKRVDQIRSLSGVTQDDFESLYIKTIHRFIEFKREPNQLLDEAPIISVLDTVVLALKRRQGYLLPLGTDSETVFREREEWTYAVFTAALLEPIEKTVRLAIVKSLLPVLGFAWLDRNKALFKLWQGYLSSDSQENIFSELVFTPAEKTEPCEQPKKSEQASQDRVSGKLETKLTVATAATPVSQPSVAPIPPQRSKSVKENGVQEKKTESPTPQIPFPANTAIQEIDLADLSAKQSQVVQASQNEEQANQTTSTDLLPTLTATDFWRWLKQGVTRNQIRLNEVDSVVQGVKEGLFVQIPEAVNRFLQDQAKRLGMETSSVLLSQGPVLTKAIKKHSDLVRNAQGSCIHVYCIGKWEERNVISGVVIKTQTVLGENYDLSVNSSLTLDPLDNT